MRAYLVADVQKPYSELTDLVRAAGIAPLEGTNANMCSVRKACAKPTRTQ
jgi:hypothetical protein